MCRFFISWWRMEVVSRFTVCASASFVEGFFESRELVFASHAAPPPCLEESAAVAQKLNEGGPDAQQTYFSAVVLDGRVDKDDGGIEQEGSQSGQTHEESKCLLHTGRQREEQNDARDRKSTRLNSSHEIPSRMPSSA